MHRSSIGSDGAERLRRMALFEDLSLRWPRRGVERSSAAAPALAGEILMLQGDRGYEFMLLEQGRAEVRHDGEPINELGPGDFFGELAVLEDGSGRSSSVIALSDVRALVFTAHFMREIHARLPALGERIDRVASERLQRDADRSADGRG